MNCKRIVKEYLENKGYDGLCNSDIDCGCTLDDFNPCEECLSECYPAKLIKNKDGKHILIKN